MDPLSLEIALLKSFLSIPPDQLLSEGQLSSVLSVPGSSIKAIIDGLTRDGFLIEFIEEKGYRLVDYPKHLSYKCLKAYLVNKYQDNRTLRLLDVIDSTNNEVSQLFSQDMPLPITVIAKRQTAGRGRRGRVWESNDEENIYISFGFQPMRMASEMHLFGLWVAIQMCLFINDLVGGGVQVKWPNDIIYKGKKLSGILIETVIERSMVKQLILGIGFNVNSEISRLVSTALSVSEILGFQCNLNTVCCRLMQVIFDAYNSFFDNNYKKSFSDLWMQYDFLLNKSVIVEKAGKQIEGVCMGIDLLGRLRLKPDCDNEILIEAGEVSIKGAYNAS